MQIRIEVEYMLTKNTLNTFLHVNKVSYFLTSVKDKCKRMSGVSVIRGRFYGAVRCAWKKRHLVHRRGLISAVNFSQNTNDFFAVKT